MSESIKNLMTRAVELHGHAAVAMELAAMVGWQARWMPPSDVPRIAAAVQKLTEACNILTSLEAEEASCRAAE